MNEQHIRNKIPPELINRLENAMESIGFGEARITWQQNGVFMGLEILEKLRFDNPEKDLSSSYKRG